MMVLMGYMKNLYVKDNPFEKGLERCKDLLNKKEGEKNVSK